MHLLMEGNFIVGQEVGDGLSDSGSDGRMNLNEQELGGGNRGMCRVMGAGRRAGDGSG